MVFVFLSLNILLGCGFGYRVSSLRVFFKDFLENHFHEHAIETATSCTARIIEPGTKGGTERSVIQNCHW